MVFGWFQTKRKFLIEDWAVFLRTISLQISQDSNFFRKMIKHKQIAQIVNFLSYFPKKVCFSLFLDAV